MNEIKINTKASNRWDRINSKMDEYVKLGMFPGFVTLVYQHGQIVHEYSSGLMNIKDNLPVQKDTIFRIYSMSKPLTCTALMMLFEEGKFFLDEPIFPYIPEFKDMMVYVGMDDNGIKLEAAQRPITIRHLLTHTAGLGYGFMEGPVEEMYHQSKVFNWQALSPLTPIEEIIHIISRLPLAAQPGTRFGYSVAHDVIGYLVKIFSGMPFDEFLKKRLFEPLGMADTGFYVPAEKVDRFAALYNYKDGHLNLVDPPGGVFSRPPAAAMGGSGMVSTIGDYLRFTRMLLNGGKLDGVNILSRKTIELMAANHLASGMLPWAIFPEFPAYGSGYGLGFSVIMDRALAGALTSNGTFGWSGAAGTHMFIDPQEDMIGILMTQTNVITSDPLPPHSDIFQRLVYQALD